MIRRHRNRRWLPALLACGLLAATVATGSAPALAAAPLAVVDAAVLDDADDGPNTTFWVMLAAQADLSGAADRSQDDGSRAEFVYEAKTTHAERTQAGLRALLTERGAEFSSFWMDNSLLVTGDRALVDELAARPEVAAIEADTEIALPEPESAAASSQAAAGTVEWNIDRINAPDVWDLGVRGEGVVVAELGRGAQYDHPALVGSYRGTLPDGTFDHEYNWFDPGGDCATEAPCDSTGGHGTHSTGTMVGVEPLPDGSVNHIGVAPGARWISTTGCAYNTCTREELVAAGQWLVAPTDNRGEHPRPDLAPDVINNSWIGDLNSGWYQETVRSWVAAGIFPVFAAGGAGCGGIGAPADYPESYTVAASDQNDQVAWWTGRGSELRPDIKPDIVAPGENIRSASVGGGYLTGAGSSSFAAPHVAGTVALMWSHTPSLQGDVAATRAALDQSAIDVPDLSCGGTPEHNYAAGEGRLDAFAAVTANPRGYVGSLTGRVTSAGTGAAVAGARITVTGPQMEEITSDADGGFRLPRLLEGDYTVAVRAFGHEDASATVTVVRDDTVTSDQALVRLPHATITGTVGADHGQAPGATVRVAGGMASATVDDTGAYRLDLPLGSYELIAEHQDNHCLTPVRRQVEVTGDTTVEFAMSDRVDGYGYRCQVTDDDEWVGGTTKVASIPEAGARLPLPFAMPLYGKTYRNMWLYRWGMVSLADEPTGYWAPRFNLPVPSADRPNATLFPMWDHWAVLSTSGVYTDVIGTAPNRTFVIEWRDVRNSPMFNQTATFAAMLGEDGTITYRYGELTGTRAATGTGATIGLEDATGTTGFEYSLNESAIRTGMGITFSPAETGLLRGTVTDGNDGLPVGASTVALRRDGTTVAADTTVTDGRYSVQAPPGDYELVVAADRYETTTVPVTVKRGGVAEQPAPLRTPKVAVPAAVDWVVPAGESRQRSMTLGNTGTLGTDVTVAEATDVPWLTVTTGAGRIEPGGQATTTVALDAGELAAGTVHRAELVITSGSGRVPRQTVPVTFVVPLHQIAVDTGGKAGRVDSLGDTWVADQAHRSGSFGYVESGRSKTRSTTAPIAGTADPARYQTQREGMYKYRFDGLTAGTYTVELEFAELTRARPGDRVFDVIAENVQIVANLDIARRVGGHAALTTTATVRVTDGSLDLRFAEQARDGTPIVSAVRITHRPDQP